jgi:hypothetical protein
MRALFLVFIAILLHGCAVVSPPMEISPTADGKYWVLTRALEYEQPQTKQKFVVPRGFVTDLASVPRLFWSVFPPCGKYTTAAVIHDYLYWQQPKECQKDCADKLLLVAMEEAGVGFRSRNAIYKAVQLGGQPSWDKNVTDKASGVIRFVPEKFMDFGPYDTWEQIEKRIHSSKIK